VSAECDVGNSSRTETSEDLGSMSAKRHSVEDTRAGVARLGGGGEDAREDDWREKREGQLRG
jgi:hypothetical protein